jgi:hypothetical protein
MREGTPARQALRCLPPAVDHRGWKRATRIRCERWIIGSTIQPVHDVAWTQFSPRKYEIATPTPSFGFGRMGLHAGAERIPNVNILSRGQPDGAGRVTISAAMCRSVPPFK